MPTGPKRRSDQERAFAAAVKAARVEKGLTQVELAERAGVGLTSLQRVEQGVGRFTLADAVALAAAPGRTVDQLVAKAARMDPGARGGSDRPRFAVGGC